MRLSFSVIIALLIVTANQTSQACRFNVRDVGMVDFADLPYKLYTIVDDSVPEDDIAAIRQISYAAMIDSNVATGIVHIQKDAGHRAIQFYEELGKPSLPALVMVSPKDKPLHLEWKKPDSAFKESVWSTMESVSESPFREALLKECINTYGVVLLIDGMNMDVNNKAEALCRRAIEKVTEGMDDLPKEVKYPPVFANLLRKHFETESLFMWSFGIDPKEVNEPMVAIVYGRGRQIGKILKGDEITVENVLSILSVVGLSCECGLDRSWMMGTMFPLKWSDERRTLAMQNVGFDTESPMVKTEISQIMSNGSLTKKEGSGAGYSSPDPLLGYAEISLEDAYIYKDAAKMREAGLQEVVDNDINRTRFLSQDYHQPSAEPEIQAKVNPDDIANQLQASEKVHYVTTTVKINRDAMPSLEIDPDPKVVANNIKIEKTGHGELVSEIFINENNQTIAASIAGDEHTNPQSQLNASSQGDAQFFKSSANKTTAVMFTVFGILATVAIISGMVVLFIARGRQA